MNNTDTVGGAQCLKNVGRVAQRLRDRESALRAQQLAQVCAVDELHDEEPLTRDYALIEHGDDAGMNDARG